jgi:hypothetical protein
MACTDRALAPQREARIQVQFSVAQLYYWARVVELAGESPAAAETAKDTSVASSSSRSPVLTRVLRKPNAAHTRPMVRPTPVPPPPRPRSYEPSSVALLVGTARLEVHLGFDPALLRAVVRALREEA